MKAKEVYEKLGLFYLGREKDLQSGEDTENLLLLKNKNLTTHAAIIGMTGSGKTGLGVGHRRSGTRRHSRDRDRPKRRYGRSAAGISRFRS